MSSFVVSDALILGLKEGLQVGIIWLVVRSYLLSRGREHLWKVFASGVLVSALFVFVVPLLPAGVLPKDIIARLITSGFAVFLLGSGVALLDAGGVDLFGPLRALGAMTPVRTVAVLIAALVFFIPDAASVGINLTELAALNEKGIWSHLSAAMGLLSSAGGLVYASRKVSTRLVGSFFDLPQLVLCLAMVKLLTGGTGGISELSLVPAVQRGLMKFSHDIIHQTFVILMVPDHPLLKTTVWNFIGFLFGPNIASMESLVILLAIPLIFIAHSLGQPVNGSDAPTGAGRRKLRHTVLSDRRRKALPIICFVAIVLTAWFSQSGESVSRLYVPKPRPVVADKGVVMIPVNDPTMDLRDGAMRKFALSHEGREIRLLVMKKPDNTLTACLDACEICPPEGYGQREDHVVCIYCNTPIPVTTLGKAGGCNPIPLEAGIDAQFVRIQVSEILKKWEYVNSGRGREAVK